MKWGLFFLLISASLYSNIYVMNQEERPDKWERIQRQGIIRFNAINGDHFSQKKIKELRRQYKVDLKASDLGRFVTELSIIKEAYKKGLKWVQILDDDCEEMENLENTTADIYRSGPSLFVSRKGMEKILKDPKELCQFSPFVKKGYLCRDETAVVKYLKPIHVTEFNSGMEGVDCIYVINLDARTDKWERLIPIFEKLHLKVNRVSAINGWQLSKGDKKALAGPYRARLRGGQLGCLLSHISILKDAYERGFNRIWILEDDIEFLGELSQISNIIGKLSSIDPDWDIFYTDSDCKNEKGEYFRPSYIDPRPDQLLAPLDFYQERTRIDPQIMQIRSRFATHSMLISKKGIKKALDYFTHVYLYSPIDWDIHYIPEIRQYASSEDIVTKWRNNPYSDTISTSSLNKKVKK